MLSKDVAAVLCAADVVLSLDMVELLVDRLSRRSCGTCEPAYMLW